MNPLKSIIGSVVGAGIATGVYFFLKDYLLDQNQIGWLIWFPIVTGMLTGAMTRAMGGVAVDGRGSLFAGTLAGVIAGAAMFAAELGPSLWNQNRDFGPIRSEELASARKKLTIDPAVSEKANPATDDNAVADSVNDESTHSGKNESANDAGDANADQAVRSDLTGQSEEDMKRSMLERGELPDQAQAIANQSGKAGAPSVAPSGVAPGSEPGLWQYIIYGIGIFLAFQVARGLRSARKV